MKTPRHSPSGIPSNRENALVVGVERMGVHRAIVGFHQDDEGHWVADLECGHTRHVRHDPPWQQREWVVTPEGRAEWIGKSFECLKCGEDKG